MILNDSLAVFAVQPSRSEVKAKPTESEPFEQAHQLLANSQFHQGYTL